MRHDESDYITNVAVIHNGTLYSLPEPNRHHNVLRLIYACTGYPVWDTDEGFLDKDGDFIDRKEAMEIVIDSKQPLREYKHKGFCSPNIGLFSEDLW